MNGVANVLDCNSAPEDEAVIEIRWLTGLLRINTDETKVVPDYFQKIVQIQLHVTADDDRVRLPSDSIDLLKRNLINFVVDVKARKVDSIVRNDINQLVRRTVFTEQNL